MRPEVLYLLDIIEAGEAIDHFLAEVKEEDFCGNDLLRSAVLQKLIVIGEAAARLSKEFKAMHPEIEWADIIAFRNIAVHAYFGVQWGMVWITATQDVPDLCKQILAIRQVEFPDH